MDKFKEIIENKKQKSASRKPRYGTRKLSIGLVSCVLGYAMLVSPTVSLADEAINEPVAEEEANPEQEEETEEENKEEAQEVASPASEEAPVEEEPTKEVENVEKSESENEALNQDLKEDEIKETNDVVLAEELQESPSEDEAKEGLASEKEESSEETPAEEAEKKLVTLDEYNALQEEEDEKDNKEDNTDAKALEISEEPNPEAVQAGDTTEDAITNVEIKIGGAVNGDKTDTVNPTALPNRVKEGTTDINLEAQVDFDIPEGTKHGKTFDFVVSDNVNLHGVLESETKGKPVVFDGEEIATAEKLTDGRNGYKYTFNEKVDGLKDIRVRIIYPLFINPDKVPMGTKEYEIGDDGKYVLDEKGNPVLKADNKEKVSVTVAGKTASKDYTVEYESGVFEEKSTGPTLSGIADIDNVTDNNYNHTIYVNPTADQMLNGSHVTVQNEKGYNTITFDEEVKNSVKVYKVKDPNKLPLSFGNDFNDGNYEDVTSKANVKLVKDNNNADLMKLVVDVKQGNTNQSQPFDNKDFDNSSYVITYTGKRTPNKAFKTNTIYTADWRKAKGNVKNLSKLGDQSWEWTNEIVIDDADAIAIANKTYNLGDKVWIDADEDGSQGDSENGLEGVKVILKGINMSDKETTTDANGNYKFEGLKNGEYTVEFEIPTGYAPTTVKAEGVTDKDNSDASQVDGTKVATATGTINGADNMNVDFGVVVSQEGSFQEHHIYITKDQDGVETGRKEEDGKLQEGKKEETYKTGKVEKDGFEFARTETPVNEPTFDEKGAEKTGNYKPGVKQEITYVYEKTVNNPQKEPGSFIEHHIYITKDQDGVETGRKEEDGKLQEGKKEETYKTGKVEKDGFEFARTETPVNEPTFDEKGAEKTGNYKPGVKQEITYVYEKTEVKQTPIEETGKFQEHHIYITKDEDGKEIGREVKDGDVSGGTKDMTYTTGKKEKDGFKFVRTENPVEDPRYNEKGESTTGNFKPGVKQEITYVYEKREWTPIEETGKFQEHHIYITKDEDGKEIGREVKDGDVSGGTKDMTYTTGKKEKDGFKFVRTENPVEEPSYNENGDKKEGNYKPGVKQEITYVYEKTVTSEKPSEPTTPTTPSEPEEPTVPSTPDEPTVPSTPEGPTVPSTPDEPTVPSTPEEPEDTTPLIPLTPTDPIDKAREVIEREENNRNEVKVPGHKKSDNPKTGIVSSLGVMGTLAASALAFLGLDDKKRKNK